MGDQFQRLCQIMARLRGPGGCPWDREQTFDTLKPYLVEEAYEVLDAIDRRDWAGLAEELGDLILQPVFLAQMASELPAGTGFHIGDALNNISEKLIRRHPHVFSDGKADTAQAVTARWDEIKQGEKAAKGLAPAALLDGVPRAQPALVEAQQLTAKAAKVGFDWPEAGQVVQKLEEETAEFRDARAVGSRDRMEDELGDLLFVVVNLARWHQVDAEQALRRANAKFRRRFGHVERALGPRLGEAGLDEMEGLWLEAKGLEAKREEASGRD